MSLKFKYTTRFECSGSIVKKDSDEGQKIALASKGLEELKPLRALAPSAEEISNNPDLHYIVFNGAVTSLANLNHDCIDNTTAVKICNSFVNKFIDIEHSRSQCVGVITNAGFSKFTENTLVDESVVASDNTPHNMAFCGVIWKMVDRYLHEMIEESNDSESFMYKKISASWEVGFNEYCIARGSRNLNQAQIITDEKEVERLSKYLLCEGGSGFDDTNTEVYRLICGDVVPLGMGLVRSPAASVVGVYSVEPDEESEDDEEDDEDETEEQEEAKKCGDNDMEYSSQDLKDKSLYAKQENIDEIVASVIKILEEKPELTKNIYLGNNASNVSDTDFSPICASTIKILEKKQEVISQPEKKIVKPIKTMKFKDVDSLLENLEVAEASAVTTETIRQFFADTVNKAGVEYSAIVAEKESQEKALQDAIAKFSQAKEELDKLTSELSSLKEEVDKNHKLNIFNDRIKSLSEAYILNDKACKILAKQIKDLDEEAYASWLEEDAEIILASFKKPAEKEGKTPEQVLNEAKASAGFVPNAGDNNEPQKPTSTPWKLGEHFSIN